MVNEQSRASARIRADDFGDCAFPETAIARSTEKGNTNLSAGMSGWMLKAFRQKIAQIDNLPARCHSQRWHNRRICSSEHNSEGTQTFQSVRPTEFYSATTAAACNTEVSGFGNPLGAQARGPCS